MATENPRVWFKSISLENVRSFGSKQTINFTDKDGNAARWNVILGDNGTGKTTVLNNLYMLWGYSTYVDYSYNLRFKDKRARVKGKLETKNLDSTKIESNLRRDYAHIHQPLKDENKNDIYLNKVVPVIFNSEEDKEGLMVVGLTPLHEEPKAEINGYERYGLLAAYSATRKIGDLGLTKDNREKNFTLLDEGESLINAEEWLVQSDYLAYKDENLRERYSLVNKILLRLFQGEVSDIYIDTKSGVPKVFFKTHYGDVRLHELSLGYKTLSAWMVDFAKGLFDRYPESENPLAEPAVCLVDEIDLHLHPKFQRNIIQFLTETFPNTQFIVTAHSPLIVVATEERPLDANIILLKREGDQTVVVNDPVDVSTWSVDQILNSDLFGHVQPASEPLNELRTERDSLLAKSKLSKKDQERLAELDDKIGFVPFGRDQAEIKAETIIQQLADVLRSKQSAQ